MYAFPDYFFSHPNDIYNHLNNLHLLIYLHVYIFQAKEYVSSFFNRCVRPFEQFIQTCGHNRARQRDKVAHLLEEFAVLQDEVSTRIVYIQTVRTGVKQQISISYLFRRKKAIPRANDWISDIYTKDMNEEVCHVTYSIYVSFVM